MRLNEFLENLENELNEKTKDTFFGKGKKGAKYQTIAHKVGEGNINSLRNELQNKGKKVEVLEAAKAFKTGTSFPKIGDDVDAIIIDEANTSPQIYNNVMKFVNQLGPDKEVYLYKILGMGNVQN